MQVGALEIKLFTDIARIQSDMNKANQTVDRAMGNIEKSVNVAKRAFGGLFAGVGVASLAKTVDEYKRFDSQLKLATKTTQEYGEAYANVVRIAKTSQSDIGAVGVLYARLTNNLRDFGTTQKEISTITEAVSLSLRVSNATVQETNSVMLQLSQSFGSGKINGQEFLAVSEGAPIIMRQLAKSLNKTYGELKNLSTQGKLTSEVLKTALSDPAYIASLREQVKAVGTISSALQVAKNNFTQYIGEADKGAGTSKLLSQGIIFLSENINKLVTVAIAAAAVSLGRYATSIVSAVVAIGAENTATIASIALKQKLAAQEVFLAERKLVSVKNEVALSVAMAQSAAASNAALASKLSYNAAIVKLDKAQTALAGKQLALNTAMAAGTAGASLLSKGIAFLGGGIGIALIAFVSFYDSIKNWVEKTRGLTEAVKELNAEIIINKGLRDLGVAADDPNAMEKKSIAELDAKIKEAKARTKRLSALTQMFNAGKGGTITDQNRVDTGSAFYASAATVGKNAESALVAQLSLLDQYETVLKEKKQVLGKKIETGYSQEELDNFAKVSEKYKTAQEISKAYKKDLIELKAASKALGDSEQETASKIALLKQQHYKTEKANNTANKDTTAEKIRQLTIESKLIRDGVPEVVAKAAAQAKLNGATESQVIAIMNLTQAEYDREAALKLSNEQQKLAQDLAKQYTEDLQSSTRSLIELVGAEQQSVAKMQEEIDLLGKGSQYLTDMEVARLRAAAAAYEYNIAMGYLNNLSKENIEYLKQQVKGLNELADAKANAEEVSLRLNSFKLDKEQADNRIKETARAQDEIEKEAKRSNEEIGKSLTDALLRGFESGKGFARNFRDTLVNLFKTLVLKPVIQFLVDSSGISKVLSGLGGILTGGSSGVAGEVLTGTSGNSIFGKLSSIGDIFSKGNDAIINGISSLGSSLSAFGSSGTGFFKDIASKFGSALQLNSAVFAKVLPYAGAFLSLLKGDFKGAAFTAAGTAIGNLLLPGIGGAIGGFLGNAIGGLFGKKKPRAKIFSTNANTVFENGEIVSNNNIAQSSGKRFVSLGAETQLNGLNEAFSRTLGALLKAYGLSDNIATSSYVGQRKKTARGTFNATVNGKSAYSYDVGGNGTADSAMTALIEAVLGTGLSQSIMASALPAGVKKFFEKLVKKEDVIEAINTLIGLKSALVDLPPIFDAIRNAIDTTSYKTSIADLKTRFAAIGTYTSLFYSAEEQFAIFTKQLTGQFSALNTALPSSRGGYRSLVDGINVTDLATSNLFNGLVALAPAMDTYFKNLEAQAEAINQVNEALAANLDSKLFGSYANFASAQANVAIGNSPQNFIGTNTFTPSGNPALLLEIKTLREEQANTRTVLEAIAAYTYDTAKTQKQWNNDGLPAVRS